MHHRLQLNNITDQRELYMHGFFFFFFLIRTYFLYYWSSWIVSFLKHVFRRMQRKPLTGTALRLMCHTSATASNTKLFHRGWTQLHNLWKFWHSKTGNSWCKLFGYWLWKQTLEVLRTQWRLWGGGKLKGNGLPVEGQPQYNGQGTEQIHFRLHSGSYVTVALKGVFIASAFLSPDLNPSNIKKLRKDSA